MKRPTYDDDLPLHPLRLWLEQFWQPALVTEEVAKGCLAVLVHQAPPLVIEHPFMYTVGAVETVGVLAGAAPHRARKFGVGCRYH